MLSQIRKFSTTSLKYNKSRFVPTEGTYPQGYKVGAISTQVKKNNTLDLSLLTSSIPASAAAVFTTNKFKAAPVIASKDVLSKTKGNGINAIVVNSGCANAVTGQGGLSDAYSMIETTDSLFGAVENPSTLVMSTGVIGQRLQMSKILPGISKLSTQLGSDHEAWLNCAKGIMTTDTFPKLVSKQFVLSDGITYKLAGLAKGAGMICPNMATLLGFFVTDAKIEPSTLSKILQHAVDRSFNCISVDGDMSTNDTITALANGAAASKQSTTITETHPDFIKIQYEITQFAKQLAQLVVRDGEGATKFITIKVKNALNFKDAKKVASTIANSSLFKTAMYGEDANWGRILCAVGYSDVEVNTSKTNVSFVPVDGSARLNLLVNGEPELVDEDRASEILKGEELIIEVDLGMKLETSDIKAEAEDNEHKGECEFWTCDLSHEYVTINGDYRS
ncbi:hypothetical protein CANARDRAFT_200894 [[Candida] arabinofermentans NRRL YB-2248]|uniref:Arginine biosynthesis bifunctional protein ArgJ, mitochondrial n=1 Tax=[Candida] arabinofermentans NRRL YB-2248 TaxID=983967 RepID=A0A1E4SYC8_9ASCO|nr:hypothetical protein CANARDRAFT_200894 [[Candida] arabinofermentans NRRL YB-2248]